MSMVPTFHPEETLPLILFIGFLCFFLSFILLLKTLIGSAIELITIVASNSLLILCFCNLIIVILLLGGSSKPTSDFARDSPIPVPTGACRNEYEIGAAGDKNDSGSTEDGELCAEKAMVDDDGDEEENENDIEQEEEEEDDDDDKLRRKVEEFIDKDQQRVEGRKVEDIPYGMKTQSLQ